MPNETRHEEQTTSTSHMTIIPEDNIHDDADSAIGPGDEDSTASLSSSVLNYVYENGRRYHAYRQGEYLIPNDDREQERMELHHHIYRLVVGGALYLAPIGDNPRILDLGTGTGIWALEVADELPSATVIGTDLSPIQPLWVPPNCIFEVDDFESSWNFSQPFDFIHGRGLEGSIRDHPKLLEEAMKHLNPGGWIELVDATVRIFSDDGTIDKSPFTLEWAALLREGSAKFGKPMGIAHRYKEWMIDAGFQNVKEVAKKVPMSPWAKDPKMKELGRCQRTMMLEALEAYSFGLFTRVLEWDATRIQILLAGVRKEFADRSIHTYAQMYFVYGQKPETT